jgi:hypothetical protein
MPLSPAIRWEQSLVAGMLGLLVLGIRLAVFEYAGSPLPYYDQWIAEYHNLLLPAVGHSNEGLWPLLFTPHNEHLLVTSKLITLAGFWLNGYWDVHFLVVASAFTRAACAAVTYLLLTESAKGRVRIAIWVVCAVNFAAPLSAYNLLSGLQISFSLADLSFLTSLWIVQRWSSATSAPALFFATAAGLGSLSSALAIPGAVLAFHLLDGRRRIWFWRAWASTAALAALYVAQRSTLIAHQSETTSLTIITFFLSLLAWPIGSALLGVAIVILLVVVGERRFRVPVRDSQLALIVAMATFGALNAGFLALQRTPATLHMRHWETLGWVPLALIALGTRLATRSDTKRKWFVAGTTVLAGAYTIALTGLFFDQTKPYLLAAHHRHEEALSFYRPMVLSGPGLLNQAHQLNGRLNERDYAFFDDPIGRFAIHPSVAYSIAQNYVPALSLLSPALIPVRATSFAGRLTWWLIRSGKWLAIFSIMAAATMMIVRRSQPLVMGASMPP